MLLSRRDFALDLILLGAAAGAIWVGEQAGGPPFGLDWSLFFAAVTLLALGAFHLYRPRFAPRFLDDVGTIIAATAIAAMAMTFIRTLFTDDPLAAGYAVRSWLLSGVYLIAGRAGIQIVEARRRRLGVDRERTLIVGAGRVGRLVEQRLRERAGFGLEPVAFFDHDPLDLGAAPEIPVEGPGSSRGREPATVAAELEGTLRRHSVTRAIFTFSLSPHEVELALVRRCQQLGVSVSMVPRLFEGLPDETELERLGGLPLVTVYPSNPHGWQFTIKYTLDRLLAGIALVVLSPVLILAAAGTAISSGTPVLFRQRRVGMDGHEFEILKFRTMRESPAQVAGVGFVLPHGTAPGGVEGVDRRTRFGAILRRTSIDELPQLLNVVRGDMSLIGPRPERSEYVRSFDHSVYRYADRARVKSGITGWAQVNGLRGRTSLADRVEWDNYYIENWSPWLDLKILVLTAMAVFRDRGE